MSLVVTLRRLYKAAAWSFNNQRERPVNYDWFTEAEVAGYDSAADSASSRRVDDQTWRDLGINALLREIALQHSIFARQFLYRQLRRGRQAPDERALYQLQSGSSADNAVLLDSTARVVEMLRCIDIDLTPLLFKEKLPSLPTWIGQLWVVPWALTLILFAGWIAPSAPVAFALLAYLGFVGWVQIRLYAPLKQWRKHQDALNKLVDAALKCSRLGRQHPHPMLEEVVAGEGVAMATQRQIKLPWYERTAAIAEYGNLVFLHEYARLYKRVETIRDALPALRQIYDLVARFEGGLAVLAHLQSSPIHCSASFSHGRGLNIEDLVHPLAKNPVPLTLSLDGRHGAFISGQNGAGKSTLLRSVGLSLVIGRALGFCHARHAELPFATVCSSMEHADSIERSESLYMAEMRRAKELLEQANADSTAVFLIDEIFRGTNNIESVSAGAAVVSRLARNHLAMISSHNLILAPLLSEHLAPLHIHFSGDPSRPITIKHGIMTETNGIDMMRRYGLPTSSIQQATEVFEWFSSYTIKPTAYPRVR